MRRTLGLFALAIVVVLVAGFLAGFGKGRVDRMREDPSPTPGSSGAAVVATVPG